MGPEQPVDNRHLNYNQNDIDLLRKLEHPNSSMYSQQQSIAPVDETQKNRGKDIEYGYNNPTKKSGEQKYTELLEKGKLKKSIEKYNDIGGIGVDRVQKKFTILVNDLMPEFNKILNNQESEEGRISLIRELSKKISTPEAVLKNLIDNQPVYNNSKSSEVGQAKREEPRKRAMSDVENDYSNQSNNNPIKKSKEQKSTESSEMKKLEGFIALCNGVVGSGINMLQEKYIILTRQIIPAFDEILNKQANEEDKASLIKDLSGKVNFSEGVLKNLINDHHVNKNPKPSEVEQEKEEELRKRKTGNVKNDDFNKRPKIQKSTNLSELSGLEAKLQEPLEGYKKIVLSGDKEKRKEMITQTFIPILHDFLQGKKEAGERNKIIENFSKITGFHESAVGSWATMMKPTHSVSSGVSEKKIPTHSKSRR